MFWQTTMGSSLRPMTLLCLFLFVLSGCVGASHPESKAFTPKVLRGDAPIDPGAGSLRPDLAQDVRAEFLRSYQAYLRLASDHDELHPVSGRGSDFFAEGHPIRLATIESLDTLYLMGLDDQLADGVDFVCHRLSFDIDADFQVFETIIRVVGGLLSGYHASQEACVLDQARELTDRLMPAFDKSATGMPYRYVNLHSGAVTGTNNVLAEIGTCVTEFGDLSLLTGDARYVQAAKKALKAVYDRRSANDLVGTSINIETGQWTGTPVVSTINPPVDSFFEYLFEGYYFLGDTDLKSWYETLNGAILRRQTLTVPAASTSPSLENNVWYSSVEYQTGAPTSILQSELAAFYAGLLAQSGHVAEGRAYHDAWKAVLDKGGYRILPEGLSPVQYQAVGKGNDLRPEYVDSALLLWLETGDAKFVERAAEYWQNMKTTQRVANGYTVLDDVTTRPETQGDLTPAYWYSENMKYYYLLFGHPERFDYKDNYLTTEGNVLRGLLHP